jgi:hypothetical protein
MPSIILCCYDQVPLLAMCLEYAGTQPPHSRKRAWDMLMPLKHAMPVLCGHTTFLP